MSSVPLGVRCIFSGGQMCKVFTSTPATPCFVKKAGRNHGHSCDHFRARMCRLVFMAAGAASASARLTRLRRWPTGKLVQLQHRSGHRFEFLVERRADAVLLSSLNTPFQRLSLPTIVPENFKTLDLHTANAIGSEKDWPLFWTILESDSWESHSQRCVEIRSARRSDVALSVLHGRLVLSSSSEAFLEISCADPPETPLPKAGGGLSLCDWSQNSLSDSQLLDFAGKGVLVLRKAVPETLWQSACALVHSELGRPGAIIDGGFDCMGKLEGKILHRAQFPALLSETDSSGPNLAARACAQLLGRRVKLRDRQRCQVALRFPEPTLPLSSGKHFTWFYIYFYMTFEYNWLIWPFYLCIRPNLHFFPR